MRLDTHLRYPVVCLLPILAIALARYISLYYFGPDLYDAAHGDSTLGTFSRMEAGFGLAAIQPLFEACRSSIAPDALINYVPFGKCVEATALSATIGGIILVLSMPFVIVVFMRRGLSFGWARNFGLIVFFATVISLLFYLYDHHDVRQAERICLLPAWPCTAGLTPAASDGALWTVWFSTGAMLLGFSPLIALSARWCTKRAK